MIFSVNYRSKHKQDAQEIKCPINQLGNIFAFIKDNPNKRYNIQTISDEPLSNKEQEQIELVKAVTDNYTVTCGIPSQLDTLVKKGYHAYLNLPATDWEYFGQLKELGVSDIRIDGPLGFQMDKIAMGKENIKIRVSPTVSPNSFMTDGKPNNFFIRPEDLKYYTPIDVIDFGRYSIKNQEMEDALFSIYNRGSFGYSLKDLMFNLPYDVNNLLFEDNFALQRLNCGQRCKEPGRHCHWCYNTFTVIEDSLKLIERSN